MNTQMFAYPIRKLLPMQGGNLNWMAKRSLNEIIAHNLKWFMERDDALYDNANALSVATKGAVSPNFIRYLLEPKRRTVTSSKAEGYPTLDKLESLAKQLPKCETWMLIHPDIERAKRATEMDEKIQSEYDASKKKAGRPRETQREGT